jgi:hypothetical protein
MDPVTAVSVTRGGEGGLGAVARVAGGGIATLDAAAFTLERASYATWHESTSLTGALRFFCCAS